MSDRRFISIALFAMAWFFVVPAVWKLLFVPSSWWEAMRVTDARHPVPFLLAAVALFAVAWLVKS